MKIKNAAMIIMTCICLIVFCSCNKNSKPDFKGGNLKSHSSDFSVPISYNEESQIVETYYKNVTYSIVETDKDNKTITLDITVPDFASILKTTIDENYNGNNSEDYDTLLESIKDKFNDELNDSSHPTLNKQITLSIDKDENGKRKIVPNDEFYSFISEPIIQAMEG